MLYAERVIMPTPAAADSGGLVRGGSTLGGLGITPLAGRTLWSGERGARRIGGIDVSVLSAARVEGPLVVYRAGFEAELAALGYTELSATQQVRLLGHLSRWLADHDVEPAGLDREGVEAFLAERRAAGHIQWISWEGMRPLLPFLMAVGTSPSRT